MIKKNQENKHFHPLFFRNEAQAGISQLLLLFAMPAFEDSKTKKNGRL